MTRCPRLPLGLGLGLGLGLETGCQTSAVSKNWTPWSTAKSKTSRSSSSLAGSYFQKSESPHAHAPMPTRGARRSASVSAAAALVASATVGDSLALIAKASAAVAADAASTKGGRPAGENVVAVAAAAAADSASRRRYCGRGARPARSGNSKNIRHAFQLIPRHTSRDANPRKRGEPVLHHSRSATCVYIDAAKTVFTYERAGTISARWHAERGDNTPLSHGTYKVRTSQLLYSGPVTQERSYHRQTSFPKANTD
jgi:hypothetical protein